MIKVLCYKCQKELDEQGALVFSPRYHDGVVAKLRLCIECWLLLEKWLLNK